MDLRDYLRVLRTRWVLIAICALMTVAGAGAITLSATPQFASSARLFVSTSGSSDDVQALQGGQFSLQRVKSYADLLTGQAIAKRVVDKLELDESPKELAGQISATSKLDTVILTITVTDPSPDRAKLLANALSEEFIGYVAELETPPGKDEATIKATVVDPASDPDVPVSPRPKRNLGLGLILGLLIGAGLAVLRDTFDTSVRTADQLEELTDAPMLGGIAYDQDAASEPLLSNLSSYAPRVEAFRVLRTNLQFIDPDKTRNVFVITSSLPSEGKTTTATNLALVLAEGGERVALVEGDLRRPKVASYMQLEGVVGLTTVLVGRMDLSDAVQQAAAHPGLDVLTSGRIPPNPAELLKSQAMSTIVQHLSKQYDVVLIDAPPLLPVTDAALLASLADGAILVVRHGSTTVDQVRHSVERLASVGATLVGTIFNMTPAKGGGQYGYGYGYGYAPTDLPAHAEKPSKKVRRSKRV